MSPTWETATDWDSAQDETGTIHEQPTGTDYPASSKVAKGYGSTIGNLVALYPFEEDSGTTINDISGNGNDGSVTGATANVTGSIFGRSAYSFDAADDYFISDGTMNNNGSQFTVLAWHYYTGTQSAGFSRLFGAMDDTDPSTGTSNGWWLERDDSNDRHRLKFDGTTVANEAVNYLTVDAWHCHVVRGNGNNGSYHVYDADGTLNASDDGSATRTQQNNYMGAMAGDGRYEGGDLCQMVVLSTELTDTEVSELVNAPL